MICRAVKNWPPRYVLKQLQEFLGTMNYIRPHCGPEYCRVTHPLRPLLKPGARFLPNEEQLKAVQELKDLVCEFHKLCVPDEAAAIEAANAWLTGSRLQGAHMSLGLIFRGMQLGECVDSVTRIKERFFHCCTLRLICKSICNIGTAVNRSSGGC